MRAFIDAATAGTADHRSSALPALAFIGIALLQQVTSWPRRTSARTWPGRRPTPCAPSWLRHCLHLDMSFHNEHKPGRADRAHRRRRDAAVQLFLPVGDPRPGQPAAAAGHPGRPLLEDWRLGVALDPALPAIIAVVLNRVRGLAVPHQKARREAERRAVRLPGGAAGGHERTFAPAARSTLSCAGCTSSSTRSWDTTARRRCMGRRSAWSPAALLMTLVDWPSAIVVGLPALPAAGRSPSARST